MNAEVPSAAAVAKVCERMAGGPPSEAELSALLESHPVVTGLDHWELWTLVCLRRHLDRQKWVGYIVETKLKADLAQLGTSGSLGHPEEIPQSGSVPDEPQWRYYFHGKGCCLTNDTTGESIDVDFTTNGASHQIDRFFYSNYLGDLKHAVFPESVIRRPAPFQDAWQVDVERLIENGCAIDGHAFQLTALGVAIVEALEPLASALGDSTPGDKGAGAVVYGTLSVGDSILAGQFCKAANLSVELRGRIDTEASELVAGRANWLKQASPSPKSAPAIFLTALGDLGPLLAKGAVESQLCRSPVDGIANAAVEIVRAWDLPDATEVLTRVIDFRYQEARRLLSWMKLRLTKGKKETDALPRNHQTVRTVLALLGKNGVTGLDPEMKSRVVFLLERTGGAHAGEAGLLLFLLDRQRGMELLSQALSGKVPAAHEDAAAACVLIGSGESMEILKVGLKNDDPQIQHTAATALAKFPNENATEAARAWFLRNDGIDSPLGKDVTIGERTIPTWSFEDISHANMDVMFDGTLEHLRREFASLLKTSNDNSAS